MHLNFPKSRIKGESDGPENIFLDKTMQNMTLPFNAKTTVLGAKFVLINAVFSNILGIIKFTNTENADFR